MNHLRTCIGNGAIPTMKVLIDIGGPVFGKSRFMLGLTFIGIVDLQVGKAYRATQYSRSPDIPLIAFSKKGEQGFSLRMCCGVVFIHSSLLPSIRLLF